VQLGSHPPEICLERGAFCYAAGFWAGAHLSEFPKGSGVGDGKIERAISSLKLVLRGGMSERGQGARWVSAYREYWQMKGVVSEGTS
jgi:hypothetical protein